MINNYKKVKVIYNGRIVGYLAEVDEKIAFQYDSEWLTNGFSISSFSLPLSDKVYISNSPYFNGLFGVFADSLPDGWGELLLIRMLNKNGINPNKISPITKLTLVNNTGLGGLTYLPCQNNEKTAVNIDLDRISLEAQKILNNESNLTDFDEVYKLGGASGGARPKAHIAIDNSDWIVKFPCHYDPQNIGEQEYMANSIGRKCGIKVPDFKLLDSKICSGYFATKRFDRIKEKRVHTISLSSLLETTHRIPSLDYKHLFQVIQSICVDKADLYEAFRRMCFNVLYANKDDHGKNFSFIYDDKLNGYRLSPAYDLTSLPQKAEHEMTVNGNGKPTREDIFVLAKSIGLKNNICQDIYNSIKNIIDKI